MTLEDREASAKSMYDEFLSGGDTAEALTCARELSLPGAPGCHCALIAWRLAFCSGGHDECKQ